MDYYLVLKNDQDLLQAIFKEIKNKQNCYKINNIHIFLYYFFK